MTPDALAALVARFHDLHQDRYAHSAKADPVEIVTIRAKALGLMERTEVTAAIANEGVAGKRQVWRDGDWRATPVLPRSDIGDQPVSGPLVVDEAYSALWIGAGWRVRALDGGDLMAERQNEGAV